MEDSLITSGVELMLFGMGTVVVFLTLLVVITGAMSALVKRYLPADAVAATAESAPVTDQTLLAVITAAIHEHRSRRNP